eukprot:TRINITY_DN6533_c0_g1_i2.p1 TRINITY_DN6533_c0_g1~~TRINITY_DN6533_c0_g1_i2.p1  ORF type:complete len:140 (+),score=29.18 TRINITY_DN6533_c0_g1_i2:22-441(+)
MAGELHQENADELKFNDDLSKEDCTPLLLSEVEYILNGRVDSEKQKHQGREPNMDPLLMKTLSYAKRFGFYQRDSFNAVRETVKMDDLHGFEQIQLANLCPETSDEAKSLIPSLRDGRVEEDQLEEMLEKLQTHRDFNS